MPYTSKGIGYQPTDTSEAAAESIDEYAASLRSRCYAAIKAAGSKGHTADELEVLLEARHQSTTPRIVWLHQNGHVVDSGMRRPTRSGRKAIVWIVPGAATPFLRRLRARRAR
jgi:hypothetical protein